MKNIKMYSLAALMSFALLFGSLSVALSGNSVSAATPKQELCKGAGGTLQRDGSCSAGGGGPTLNRLIENVVNILLFIIGAVAVVMIIIGGIRYTTSNGDQAQVTSAKNTILYAVVGLVVAAAAYAIVGFVIKNI